MTATGSLAAPRRPDVSERGLIWFYVGAFLGPFGTTIANVLFTAFVEDFQITLPVAGLTLTVYMVCFSLSLLISGAIADTIGARLAVTAGCSLFVIASALCALAPTIELFLIGRAGQGIANAFTTALLMASLGDLIPVERLGKAMGFFSAFQMAGGLFGPAVSGVIAIVNWRLSFWLVAVVSFALAVYYWRYYTRLGVGVTGRGGASPFRTIASLLNRRMAMLCLAAFVGYIGVPSLGYLVALDLEHRWGLAREINGFVIAGFALVNVLAAPKSGAWVDRFGRQTMIALGSGLTILLIAGLAWVPTVAGFAVIFALLGLPTIISWTALGTLSISAFPHQRGAAISIFNAAKFAGFAASPALFLPIYDQAGPQVAYLLAGLATAALAIPVWMYYQLTSGSDFQK